MRTPVRLFVLCLVVLGTVGAARPAHASLVDVFDITGTATYDADLGLWLYEYEITADSAPHGLSHWWLELPSFKAESIEDPLPLGWLAEFPEFGEPLAAAVITNLGTDLSGGNTDLFGIKWEDDSDTDFSDGMLGGFSFYSSHGPSEPDAYTWFAKFGTDYDYGGTLGPNGQTIIPEPGTLGLFGIGLLGGLWKKRRTSIHT